MPSSYSKLTLEVNDTLDPIGFDNNLSRPLISAEGGINLEIDDIDGTVSTLGGDIITDVNNNTDSGLESLTTSLTEIQSVILPYEASANITKGAMCKFDGSKLTPNKGVYSTWNTDNLSKYNTAYSLLSMGDCCVVNGTNYAVIYGARVYSGTYYTDLYVYNYSTKAFTATHNTRATNTSAAYGLISPSADTIVYFEYYSSYFYVSTYSVTSWAHKGSISLNTSTYNMSFKGFSKIGTDIIVYSYTSTRVDAYLFRTNGTYYYYVGMDSVTTGTSNFSYEKNNAYFTVKDGNSIKRYQVTVSGSTISFTKKNEWNISSAISVTDTVTTDSSSYWFYTYNSESKIVKNGTSYFLKSGTNSYDVQGADTGDRFMISCPTDSMYRIYDPTYYSVYNSGLSYTNISSSWDNPLSQNTGNYGKTLCSPVSGNIIIGFYEDNTYWYARQITIGSLSDYNESFAIAQESIASGSTGNFRLLREADIDTSRTGMTIGTKYYDDIGIAIKTDSLYFLKDFSDII